MWGAVGFRGGEAGTLVNMAVAYTALDEVNRAIELAESALSVLKAVNLPYDAAGASQTQYDDFITQLKAQRDGGASTEEVQAASDQTTSEGPSTLPAETVQTLAQNTYAVMTGAPEHLDDWRAQLQDLLGQWSQNGPDYAIEVAFAQALLGILDGESPALPDDNPYADVVRQVVAAIAEHRSGSGDS
mgnify:CR=1 FL=1